uniref:Uncharacterized protein n=1 Tax=Acrobeloides nanus TaxID=290746 RepID=A0A914D3Z6_9BILA
MSHCWLKIFVLIFLKICLCEEKKEAPGADYQKVGDLVGEWFKNPWQAAGQMGLDFAKYGLAQAGNNIGNVVQPHIKNGSNSRNSGDMLVNLLRLGVALATTPATITPASKQKFQKFTKIRASQREEEMQMVPKYPKSSDVVEKEEGNHSQPQLKAAEIGYSNDQLVNSQLESILKVLAKKKADELDALTRQTTTENPEIVRMREKMQQLEARLMEQQEMLLKKDIEDKYGKIIRRHHGDSEEYTRAPDQEDYMPEIRFKQIKDQFHPHQFEKEATPTSSYQKILPLSKIALTKTIPVTPNPSRKLETIETSSNTNTTSSSITSSEMSTRIELPTTTIASSSSNMTQVTTDTTIPATSPTRTLLEMSKDNPSSTTLELNQTSTVTTNLSSTTGIIDTYTNPKTPDLTSTEPSQTSLLTTKISSTTETTNTHPETSETDLTTTSTSEKSQTSLLTTNISSITGTNTHPETSGADLTTTSISETSQTSLLTTEISSATGTTNTHPETSEADLTTASNLDATTSTTDPQVPTMKDLSTTQTVSNTHERKLQLVKTFEEKSIPTGLYKMDEARDIQSSPSNTTQPLILHDLNEKRNRKSHFDKYRINKEKNQPSQETTTTNGTEMSPEIRMMIEKIKLLARHLLIKEVEYEKKEQKLQKLFSIMKSEKAKARLKSFQKTTPKKLRTTTQSSTTSTSEEPITTPTRRPISTSTKISKVAQRALIAKSKLKALLKRRIPIRPTSTSTYPTSTTRVRTKLRHHSAVDKEAAHPIWQVKQRLTPQFHSIVNGQLWPEYGFPSEFEAMPGYIPPQPQPYINPYQQFSPLYNQNGNELHFGYPTPSYDSSKKTEDGISAILTNLATKLPEIADKMAKIMPLTAAPPKMKAGLQIFPERTSNARAFGVKNLKPEEEPMVRNFDRAGGMGLFFATEPSVKPDKIADLINSMPEPSSLFSFNNLFSALSGKTTKANEKPYPLEPNGDEETIYDMRQINGTPIEKEEDSEPETYEKDEFASVDETPEGVSELDTKIDNPPKNSTTIPGLNFGDNILGKILTGKIDKIDWLGTFLPNGKEDQTTEGEGNALTQLLKGGLFGSAMEDSRIKNKDTFGFH